MGKLGSIPKEADFGWAQHWGQEMSQLQCQEADGPDRSKLEAHNER